jgi:imidazolonepropionase-like amidohydrolase
LTLAACSAPPFVTLAITHVTVIDVATGTTQPDSTVLISDSHIARVGPSSSVAVPRGAKTLDGSGQFLIPGLADMHLHLTGSGEPEGSREFFLPLLIANGITTVRDMGGRVDVLKKLRREVDSGERPGPQIFFTGPYLDGNPPSFQPSIVVQKDSESVAAVDQLKADGVDFIKVQSRLQPEAYFAIARQAKKQEIRFVGHVPDSITAAQASDAGQASIEHLTGVLLACSAREEELRRRQMSPPRGETPAQAKARERIWERDLLDSFSKERAAALLKKFAENNTWQVPTLVLLMDLAYVTPTTAHHNDPRLKFVPESVREVWDQGRQQALQGRSAADFEFRTELRKRSLQIVGKMDAAGIPIMAGTDAAAPNVFPGFGLQEELSYLVLAGLTPQQALRSATVGPAEFLNRTETQGTIAPGKRADLVLLDGNPLDDITNTQHIRAVVVNGKAFERNGLDQLLNSAANFAARH